MAAGNMNRYFGGLVVMTTLRNISDEYKLGSGYFLLGADSADKGLSSRFTVWMDPPFSVRRRLAAAGAQLTGLQLGAAVVLILILVSSSFDQSLQPATVRTAIFVNLLGALLTLGFWGVNRREEPSPAVKALTLPTNMMAAFLGLGICLAHTHMLGSQNTLFALSYLPLLSLLIPMFPGWYIAFLTLTWLVLYLSVVALEANGILPYAPILVAGAELEQIFLQWPVVLANTGLILLFLFVAMYSNYMLQRGMWNYRLQLEDTARRRLRELERMGRVASAVELTASIAHELSQPLGAIRSNAEAALRFLTGPHFDPFEAEDAVIQLVLDSERASEVIERLRGLLVKGKLEPVPLDIDSVVGEVLSLTNFELTRSGIQILHLGGVERRPVLGDSVQLQQVILNLVRNAADALKEHDVEQALIEVRTSALGDQVIVQVSDNGPGIPIGLTKKIFKPFATSKPTGMGMGLALSRSIVTAYGGSIEAGNRIDGRGAMLTVRLPVADWVHAP